MASTTLTTLPTLPTIVLHSWIFRRALFHPAAGKIYYQTSSNNKTKPSGSVAKPRNTLQDLTHHLCFFNMSSCSRQTFTCNRSLERYVQLCQMWILKKSKCWRKKSSQQCCWYFISLLLFSYNLFTLDNPYISSILIRYNMHTSYQFHGIYKFWIPSFPISPPTFKDPY